MTSDVVTGGNTLTLGIQFDFVSMFIDLSVGEEKDVVNQDKFSES